MADREAGRRAERVCRIVTISREPVDVLPDLRVNRSEVPLRQSLGR